MPTGPLGGNLFVDIPISPPNPNSPPSANCVDALWTAIELFIPFKNIFAVFVFRVMIASVCIVPYFNICLIASFTPFTLFIDILGDKYSVLQSLSLANLSLLLKYLFIFLSTSTSHPFRINSLIIGSE